MDHAKPNIKTTIGFSIPRTGRVTLNIYDMMGRKIRNLVNGQETAGTKSIQWDTANNAGVSISAGIYLYEIQAGEFRKVKKMVLLK